MKKIAIAVWGRRHKILRFLISGVSSTGINFFCLYAFTEWAGFHYLQSVVLAFVVSITISFVLQKLWTFQDHSRDKTQRQLFLYAVTALFNIGVNLVLVYVLVENLGWHYLAAQFVACGVIALDSFFIYQQVVFKIKSDHHL